MTASEFSRLLHGKRVAKGKYLARCPAHSDRHPSLSIAVGKRVPVVIRCMSHGCDTTAILDAMGLAWGDLFYGKPDKVLLRQIREQQEREEQRRKNQWEIACKAVKKAYNWLAASHELARLLAAYPDDERLGVLFHRSLYYMRRCEAVARVFWPDERTWGNGIMSANMRQRGVFRYRIPMTYLDGRRFEKSLPFDDERGMPILERRWPTGLKRADVGSEIATRLGMWRE